MKSTRYAAINTPIRLHLEYGKMTVGELSTILRHWQALLRAVWRVAYELQHDDKAPNIHVLTVTSSTENSFDLISDYALQTAVVANLALGPVSDWPRQARIVYAYLAHILEKVRNERPKAGLERVTIIGQNTAAITFPSHLLENEEIAGRLTGLWEIANGGDISITAEEVSELDTTEGTDDEAETRLPS